MVNSKDVAQSTPTPRKVHERDLFLSRYYTSTGIDRGQGDASGVTSDMGPDGAGPLRKDKIVGPPK